MFTGIVTAIGEVRQVRRGEGLVRWTVAAPYPAADVAVGGSICHAGCCLTVTSVEPAGEGVAYTVDIAAESLAKTTLGAVGEGGRVNLERALKMGDELGGHLVTGHVDGLGEVVGVAADGAGYRVRIAAPASLAALIAPKGSIAVDGVSLTVNEVDGNVFGVLIIPHTWEATTLSALQSGARVNLEADMLARYVARILQSRPAGV